MKRSLRLMVLLLVVAVIGLVFSPLNHSSARNVQSSEGITGTQGFPEDVGTSHFGLFFPLRGGNPPGIWSRPHISPFIWGKIEPTPGAYRWTDVDRWVRDLQRQRLAILATVFPFAQWDQESCHGSQPRLPSNVEFLQDLGSLRYSPCDSDAYAAWLSALVERYDGDGADDMPGLRYPIKHWEILNEPELRRSDLVFFQEGPEAYLELLRLSYPTVKDADPTSTVLLGAQVDMFWPEHVSFWRTVLQGAQGLFDVGNIHAIGWNNEDFFAAEYRVFLDELGYSDKPFWQTEAFPGGADNFKNLSEDELGQLALISFAKGFAHGAEVIVCVPTACDPNYPRRRANSAKEEMGLVFEVMASTVGNFTEVESLADNAVRFHMPNGRKIYALWDNALLLSWESSGTAKVITYKGEEFEQGVNQVVANVPMLVVIEP